MNTCQRKTPLDAWTTAKALVDSGGKCGFGLSLGLLVGLGLLGSTAIAQPQEAVRARHFAEATQLAQDRSADLFVFLHGSNWNRLGERLKADVWDTPAFARAMGPDAVLLSIDFPENPSVVPKRQIEQALADNVPRATIRAIQSEHGTTFRILKDGSLLAQGPLPKVEVYQATLASGARPARTLWVEGLLDESLPWHGPGRTKNGHFCISEIEVETGPKTKPVAVPLTGAWADHTHRGGQAIFMIDGEPAGKYWCPGYANPGFGSRVIVRFGHPIPPRSELRVRLHFQSPHKQHALGRFLFRLDDRVSLADAVDAWHRVERLRTDNAGFKYSTRNYPAVAMLDRDARPVTRLDGLRLGLAPEALAEQLHDWQAKRQRRDQLWAEAEQASGPRKAELLGESLDLLGLTTGNLGHNKAYQFIFKQIQEADPEDQSHYVRRYGFSHAEHIKKADQLVTEEKYQQALDYLDGQIRHPTNSRLEPISLQHLMMGKFNVYRRWPEHQDQRFDVLTEVTKLDPTTVLGIGAEGYRMMHHKGPVSLSHGWGPVHVEQGVSSWTIDVDAGKYFDHAGPYELTAKYNGGKNPIRLTRVALLRNGQEVDPIVLDELDESAALVKPNDQVVIRLTLPDREPADRIAIRIDYEASEGTDCSGLFSVNPLLE